MADCVSELSARTATVMNSVVVPARKVRVPLVGTKSFVGKVPAAVVYWTVAGRPLAAASVTGKTAFTVPEAGESTVVLPIVMFGGGLAFRMVPVPKVGVLTNALVGLLNFSVNVSLGPYIVLGSTGTVTGSEVTPGANVSVPLTAV